MDIPDEPGDGVRWERSSIRSICESFIKTMSKFHLSSYILYGVWEVIDLRDGVRCEGAFIAIESFFESFIKILLVLAVLERILSFGWCW